MNANHPLAAADDLNRLLAARHTEQSTNTQLEALALAVAANLPVLLWGEPGIGKSAALEQLADGLGVPLETVIASVHEPSDFAGLPVIGDDAAANGVPMAPPDWAVRLSKADQGIVFFDELSSAPPAVQAALLRVVLERRVGSLALPPRIRVVAAANPPSSAADGWHLSPPLANRFVHLNWTHDPRTVARGMAGTWPSPRTWEMALRLLATGYAAGASTEALSAALVGAIGDGPGIEFLAYLDQLDLPDPDQVLKNPDAFALPKRGDRQLAFLTAIVAAVQADLTRRRWEACWTVLAKAVDAGVPDVAARAAADLAAMRDTDWPVPSGIDAFLELLTLSGAFS